MNNASNKKTINYKKTVDIFKPFHIILLLKKKSFPFYMMIEMSTRTFSLLETSQIVYGHIFVRQTRQAKNLFLV